MGEDTKPMKIEQGKAWAIYVKQMKAEGITVVYGVKTMEHFYKESIERKKGSTSHGKAFVKRTVS